MARTIEKTELRTTVDGTPVLDVIFDDGTKKKLDAEKLQQRKKRLQAKRRDVKKEIDDIDESLAMIDNEKNKV